jgi:hypothetical protein
VLIQRLTEGFAPFRLGAGGSHLGEVATPDDTPMGTASVIAHTCLLEHVSEGRQTLLPHDDGALSRARRWSCSSVIATEEGTKALHQSTSKGRHHGRELSPDECPHRMTHLAGGEAQLEEAPDIGRWDSDGRQSRPGLLLWESRPSSPPLVITGGGAG